MRDAVRRAKLMPEVVREPERAVLVHLDRPDAHPGRDLQLLPQDDVRRVRLGRGEVLEEVCDRRVAEVLDRRGRDRPVEVLCCGCGAG